MEVTNAIRSDAIRAYLSFGSKRAYSRPQVHVKVDTFSTTSACREEPLYRLCNCILSMEPSI